MQSSFNIFTMADPLRPLSNTEILCFVLGWQGGTVHQVAASLGVGSENIINATYDDMQKLCRMAQRVKS